MLEDNTLADLPGVELDAEMAERILERGDAYSQQTAHLALWINTHKASFRKHLLEKGFIQASKQEVDGFDLAAVDGASAIKPHSGGALIVAAAYKTTLNDEKQRGVVDSILVPNRTELEAFATMLRIHLELSLLTSDKLDADRLVILDHSFWGIMQAISRALATYKAQRQELLEKRQNPNTDAMHRAWGEIFKKCLGIDGSFYRMIRNKQIISLSKTGISQFFLNLLLSAMGPSDPENYVLASTLNDRAVLRHVLEPGEYTTPQSLYHTVQEGGSVKSWKRSRFATHFEPTDGPDPFEARERVFDEYGLPKDASEEIKGRRLFVSYYRPYAWARAYRIEFHEAMLASRESPSDVNLTGQGERFQRVLASVRQSLTPEAKEPLAQVLADLRAKVSAATALTMLPERTFYQLQDQYRGDPAMLDIIDALIAEERT